MKRRKRLLDTLDLNTRPLRLDSYAYPSMYTSFAITPICLQILRDKVIISVSTLERLKFTWNGDPYYLRTIPHTGTKASANRSISGNSYTKDSAYQNCYPLDIF